MRSIVGGPELCEPNVCLGRVAYAKQYIPRNDQVGPSAPDATDAVRLSCPDRRVGLSAEKSKSHRHSPVLPAWRASSADPVKPYLTGQWPKDINSYHHYQSGGVFMCDKSTQTIDDWESVVEKKKTKGHRRSASFGHGDLSKEVIKQRLQKTKEGSRHSESGKQRLSPVPGIHSALSLTAPPTVFAQTKSLIIPATNHIPRQNMNRFQRNSVEGLNVCQGSSCSQQTTLMCSDLLSSRVVESHLGWLHKGQGQWISVTTRPLSLRSYSNGRAKGAGCNNRSPAPRERLPGLVAGPELRMPVGQTSNDRTRSPVRPQGPDIPLFLDNYMSVWDTPGGCHWFTGC
ncbi:hypothetical protein BaRGS_00008031 [Batillaria attramentaria]|uniref:Uncharacterized protein n=1 Tax=Batillaria attramentaria TaxID=370345 RepID=A0ABD0LP10_9CAEN